MSENVVDASMRGLEGDGGPKATHGERGKEESVLCCFLHCASSFTLCFCFVFHLALSFTSVI